MLEGMRMANEGMIAMQQQQAVITNNLANVGTAGYRKEVMDVESFSSVMNRQMKRMGKVNLPGKSANGFLQASGGMDVKGMLYTSTRTSYSQGSLKMTNNKFDLALDDNGRGFFTIRTKDGIQFTRNGSFRLSTDGHLVASDGSKLMGQKGPIKISGTDFEVTNNGIVKVGDKEVDRLLITEFPDKSNVSKYGEGNFQATDGFKISNNFQVKQGYLEMANVNAVKEMVDMMRTMRAFEANQKVLQAEDQALRKSVNEVGKTG
ncbi:MAG: flagellar hook-basal body protein [Candidatus Eremiobacteraeota bacterium]|nr:flagellar hook-basal body protein [Candidatus Eremiobacteraeota bacterium]